MIKNKFVFILLAVFFVGWVSNDIYYLFDNIDREQPFSLYSNEVKSPGNWISEKNVAFREKGIAIRVENATWSKFTDTNSMDPVLDIGAHALKVKPSSVDILSEGDIISFKTKKGNIIHRIVDISKDEEGIYFLTKGDNNKAIDLYKVRFDQITGVVVGIIY